MKRIILFIITIIFIVVGYSQSTHFYYYKNTRQYLNINTRYAYISGDIVNIQILVNDNRVLIKNPDSLDYTKGYTTIEFNDELQESDYISILQRFNRIYNIYAEPYFANNSFDKIGTSEYFYIRLKDLSDTLTLYTVAQREDCQIVLQDEFMPLWFILKKSISSRYNSLEMANRFYATELFSTAEPDLMTDGALSNDSLYFKQWN